MIARLKRLYRRMTRTPYLKQKDKVSYWFDQALKGSPTQLVQIGSNDGKTGDPLFPLLQKYTTWKALFVEPVPYLHKRLSENYTASRFTLENVAIGDAGNMDFYWVDPKAIDHLPDLPYWYDQLGSFDRNHIVKHLDGVLEPYILSAEISCITLDTLLERNNISDIGILHIDTEGHDWAILSQLDLNRWKPKFILYEYHHLSNVDLKSSLDFLKSDYHVYKVGIDNLAVRKDVQLKHINKHLTLLGS